MLQPGGVAVYVLVLTGWRALEDPLPREHGHLLSRVHCRPYAGGLSPAGLLGPPPHSRVAGPATPTAEQAEIVRDFKQAWEAKDVHALIGLLDPNVTAIGDGGGLVSAELRPIEAASWSRAPSSRSPAGHPT